MVEGSATLRVHALVQGRDGGMYLLGSEGVMQLEGAAVRRVAVPPFGAEQGMLTDLADRDGTIWAVGTGVVTAWRDSAWAAEDTSSLGIGGSLLYGVALDGRARVWVASSNALHVREDGRWRTLDLSAHWTSPPAFDGVGTGPGGVALAVASDGLLEFSSLLQAADGRGVRGDLAPVCAPGAGHDADRRDRAERRGAAPPARGQACPGRGESHGRPLVVRDEQGRGMGLPAAAIEPLPSDPALQGTQDRAVLGGRGTGAARRGARTSRASAEGPPRLRDPRCHRGDPVARAHGCTVWRDRGLAVVDDPPRAGPLGELARKRGKGETDGEDSRSPWVCTSETGARLGNIERSWRAIRTRAGLEDVRLHDLRHSAASDMLAAGLSLPIIGHVLGHKNTQTTARYAHLADQARRDAARIMGEQIERSTREGAERLRQREAEDKARAKLAAGAGGGKGEARGGAGGAVVPMGVGKVIRFPGKRHG